ncbi:MAG TPA: hypothetical protein VGK25_02045, partial [Ignavibacteria bacterium]
MKYKNLKSVAHNLGHAFLSLMNYSGSNHVIEHLFQKAKESGVNSIQIDFLNEIIEPPEFRIPDVINSLRNYRAYFPRDLESQKCSLEHIKEVKIKIIFDLNNIKLDENIEGLELPAYDCFVEILDD